MVGSIYALSTIFIQIYEGGKGKNGSTVAVCHWYLFFIYCILVDNLILAKAMRTC